MARSDLPDELVDWTLEVWQPRSTRLLSRHDAYEILENVAGFFYVLLRWERAERQQDGPRVEHDGEPGGQGLVVASRTPLLRKSQAP